MFGGLAASGWHTASLTMRLLVEGGVPIAGGIIGAGADEMRWPRPVRPGDRLRVESEVLEVRPSRSKPKQGILKMRTTTFNQNDEPVQIFTGNLVVPRRRRRDIIARHSERQRSERARNPCITVGEYGLPDSPAERRSGMTSRQRYAALFLPHSRAEAISAPSRIDLSLSHTTGSITHSRR